MSSNVLDSISEMRPGWLNRVSRQLARGAGVRESFLQQLNELYDAVLQAVETGDKAWLTPVITEWVNARTQTDLELHTEGLAPLISEIISITHEYVRETLLPEPALDVMGVLIPLFSFIYESIAEREQKLRIEIIRADLIQAREEIAHLDKSKSDFISVAAHELKTPLTLIEGYAMMIREMFPKEDQTSQTVLLLKGVDNGTRRLREIVDDMIDVSLIDNDMLKLNFQPLWLNRLLFTIRNELKEDVTRRRQVIEVSEFDGIAEMTFGDPERIYQALRNLMTNAIKYTPDGGKIKVDGRRLPGFIEITVADSGIGIDPENHSRIFQKFSQLGNVSLHSSGKTKFMGGGPGLGLPITKGIIEAHGGTIWVESDGYDEEHYHGSTFHLMLPLRKQPPDDKVAKLFEPLLESR